MVGGSVEVWGGGCVEDVGGGCVEDPSPRCKAQTSCTADVRSARAALI